MVSLLQSHKSYQHKEDAETPSLCTCLRVSPRKPFAADYILVASKKGFAIFQEKHISFMLQSVSTSKSCDGRKIFRQTNNYLPNFLLFKLFLIVALNTCVNDNLWSETCRTISMILKESVRLLVSIVVTWWSRSNKVLTKSSWINFSLSRKCWWRFTQVIWVHFMCSLHIFFHAHRRTLIQICRLKTVVCLISY